VSNPSPLTGVDVRVADASPPPVAIAARLLGEFGAHVSVGRADPGTVVASLEGRSPVSVRASAPAVTPAGLPPGSGDYALALCLVIATGAALLSGSGHEVDPAAVAVQLVLPDVLAAAHGREAPPVPAPVPTRDGTLWRDLRDADEQLLADLLGGEPVALGRAAEIASLGQAAGLPLVDFRPRSAWSRDLPLAALEPLPSSGPAAPVRVSGEAPLAGVRICDLTAMWSGPLATWLLASLGAEVLKVEPDCRLDGTREDDDGVVFQAFNRNKRRLNLDLREGEQRAAFLDEVRESDIVVSNFTPRVVTNLGIEPATLTAGRDRPLACVQMPAFPAAVPERSWRAYGHGIHAISGLGLDDAGRRWAARAPYCDALSGFAAAAVAVTLRVASIAGGGSWAADVPMLNVALQLADLSRPPRTDHRAPGNHDGEVLANVATSAGAFRLPRSPFRGPGLPIADVPAPALPTHEVTR
jgi:hypothetical protein